MKNLIFGLVLILSINIGAQNGLDHANVFIRIYDLEGKKISKGKFFSISETSLKLIRKSESLEIPVAKIGTIKTKHSAGHNMLVGAASVATFGAILGATTADPDAWIFGYTAAEGAAAGALIGGTLGASVGGIASLFKNSATYEISGDMEKLKSFYNLIMLKDQNAD